LVLSLATSAFLAGVGVWVPGGGCIAGDASSVIGDVGCVEGANASHGIFIEDVALGAAGQIGNLEREGDGKENE